MNYCEIVKKLSEDPMIKMSVHFGHDMTVRGCDFIHKAHTFYFRESQLRPISRERCTFLSKLWTEFYKIGD